MEFIFIVTKSVALGDIKGILCHFNLAFEKDWEVAEELNNRTNETENNHNRLAIPGKTCTQHGAASNLNSERLKAPIVFPSSKPCANTNEVNLINLLAF